MNKKLLLMVNPHAGKAQSKTFLFDLIQIFYQRGYEVSVFISQEAGDATKIVSQHGARFDLVACCGGDGTVHEVVAGLMALPPDKRPPLATIPLGTTNVLAASLNLSKNPLEAAREICLGKPIQFDIGSFNGRYFDFTAAFGLFTETSYRTPQPLKNNIGFLAYLLEGIKSLADLHQEHFRFEYDGNVVEDNFVFGSVSNSHSLGGVFNLTDVDFNDGLFEVVLVRMPRNLAELNSIILGLSKQNYDNRHVTFFRTSRLHVVSPYEVAWTVDGEDGGYTRNVDIVNHKGALTIMSNPCTE